MTRSQQQPSRLEKSHTADDSRRAHLEKIRSLIAAGKYHVPADKIVRKLIAANRDLL